MDSILITINQQKTKFLDRIVAGPNEKVEDEQEHIQNTKINIKRCGIIIPDHKVTTNKQLIRLNLQVFLFS